MIILRQFIRSIPYTLYIVICVVIILMEMIFNDIVFTKGNYPYIISPLHGIFIIIPLFLIIDFAMWKMEEANAVLIDLRLPSRIYCWKQNLFSLFSAFLYCIVVFLCELVVCKINQMEIPLILFSMSFIAKWLYFSILSLLICTCITYGLSEKIVSGLIGVFCVIDYISSYTRGDVRMLMWHSFSGMKVVNSWIILLLWFVSLNLLLLNGQLNFHEYVGENNSK